MRMSLIAAMTLPLLASCGHSEPNREIGGAMTGAGTGATIGILGGPVGVAGGAVIGALAGGVGGAAISPNHINLGKPFWADR